MTAPGEDDEGVNGCHRARRAMEEEEDWRASVKNEFR